MGKKFIFALILLAIPLGIAYGLWLFGEVHYRGLYGEMERNPGTDQAVKEFFIYCPNLGWRGNPNVSTRHNSGSWVTHNAHGFRDTPWDLDTEKPRVLLLGDSNAWGYGVEDDEYPAALLNEWHPEVRWFNAGMNGFATDQQYLLFHELQDKIRPDLTILLFCDNDRSENTAKRVRGYNKPYFALVEDQLVLKNHPVPEPEETDALWVSAPDAIFQRTGSYILYHVAQVIEARKSRALADEEGGLARHVDGSSNEDPTEALIAALNEATGDRLLVVSIPSDAGVFEQSRREGIPFVDLGETPVRQPGPHTYPGGRPKYGHWTPEGNRLAATYIANAALEQLNAKASSVGM